MAFAPFATVVYLGEQAPSRQGTLIFKPVLDLP